MGTDLSCPPLVFLLGGHGPPDGGRTREELIATGAPGSLLAECGPVAPVARVLGGGGRVPRPCHVCITSCCTVSVKGNHETRDNAGQAPRTPRRHAPHHALYVPEMHAQTCTCTPRSNGKGSTHRTAQARTPARDDSPHIVYNPGYRQAVSRVWQVFRRRDSGYSVLTLTAGRVRDFGEVYARARGRIAPGWLGWRGG